MDALLIVIVISFLLVGGLMFVSSIFDFGGRRSTRTRKATGKTARSAEQNEALLAAKWRSVKISPGLICCDTVGLLAGKTFLAQEAPPLPLEKCAENDCRCKYIHLDDRRRGGDRRIDIGGDLGDYLPVSRTERRHVGGRRSADLAA